MVLTSFARRGLFCYSLGAAASGRRPRRDSDGTASGDDLPFPAQAHVHQFDAEDRQTHAEVGRQMTADRGKFSELDFDGIRAS